MLSLYTLPELRYPLVSVPNVPMLSLYTLPELWYPLVLVSECAHAQSLDLTCTVISLLFLFSMCASSASTADLT